MTDRVILAIAIVSLLIFIFSTSGVAAQNDEANPRLKKMSPDKYELSTKHLPQVRFGRYHVLAPKAVRADTTYRVVLLMHGNGHGPEVMLEWARQLNLSNTFFICPEAPYLKWKESKESATGKYTAIISDSGVPDSLHEEMIAASAQWYHNVMIDAVKELSIMQIKRGEFDVPTGSRNSNRAFVQLSKPLVMGFSQGGFFAQVLATRYPDEVSGLVSMSGSTYPVAGVFELYPRLRGLPVLISHGREDATVPFSVATQSVEALTQAKVEHSFIPFTGGHWPTAEVTAQVGRWVESK